MKATKSDSPRKRKTPDGKKSNGKRTNKRKPAHFGSINNNEIETPENILHEIRKEFGRFFDPCPYVGKGKKPDFDGTTIEWEEVNFVNPPYDNIEPWCVKAIDEGRKGKTSILLVPVRTGTRYWQHYVFPYADQIRFITGKIIFKGYESPSPHHLALIIYKPNYRITQSPPPTKQIDHGDVFNGHKMLEDKPAQKLFPELSVICSIQYKAVSGQHSDPDIVAYKKKWFDRKTSLRELVQPEESIETTDILYKVCLPLFYQMCMYEKRCNNNDTSLDNLLRITSPKDFDTPYPLPLLLHRFKPLLTYNEFLCSDLFQRNSILPSATQNANFHIGIEIMTADWYKDAVGFYSAYVDNSRLSRAMITRSVYCIKSEDGEFEQHVIFL